MVGVVFCARIQPLATPTPFPYVSGSVEASVQSKSVTWTPVDRDYEALRIHMQNPFQHLHLDTVSAAA
jgi:hypothetical protein